MMIEVPVLSAGKRRRRLASSNMTSDEKVEAAENERRRVIGSWAPSRTTDNTSTALLHERRARARDRERQQ
jgi:hypothetical protein